MGRSPGEGNDYPFQYSCMGNPWTEEPGGLQPIGSQELDTTERLNHQHFVKFPNSSSEGLGLGQDMAMPRPVVTYCLPKSCLLVWGQGVGQ